MLVFKNAIHNKNLFPAIVPVGVEISLRRPTNQGGATALLHEWHHRQAWNHALKPIGCCRINNFALDLIWAKVPQLHKERATRFTEGRVRRTWRIHHVRASRIMPRFIAEGAIHDQNFFSKLM